MDVTPQQWTAAPWFLVTPPQRRRDATTRPRLWGLLDDSIARRTLTLVQAPSGYGKTTMLTGWVQHRRPATAWLSLTQHDHEPSQLLTGILTALLSVDPEEGLVAALRRTTWSPVDGRPEVLAGIIGSITTRQEPVTLIIDDVQHASTEGVAEVILPLALHTRGALRLVLAGSGMIRHWFTKQLVDDEAAVISSTDLALTADEIVDAMALASPGHPDPSGHARQIARETGGWPAAVGVLLRHPTSADPDLRDHHRGLTDYLGEHIIDRLPQELRDFVIRATTCQRLDAGLAARLTDRSDSAALLEECVRMGLFIDSYLHTGSGPGETSLTVYQWHSLFVRHCQVILRRENPDQWRALQRLAARSLSRDYPAEAVVHALSVDDGALACEIIRSSWLRMIIGGQAAVLGAACLGIPEPYADDPAIMVIRACCVDVAGDPSNATALQQKATALLAKRPEIDETTAAIHDLAALFLAHDQTTLGAAADAVHAVLTGTVLGTSAHIHATFLLGWTELRLRRHPARTVDLLSAAAADASTAGFEVLAHRARANLAFALAFAGRLTAAQTALQDNAASSHSAVEEWQHYDGGVELFVDAYLAYWRNDLARVLDRCRILHESNDSTSSYAALGRIYIAQAAAALRQPALMAEAESLLGAVSNTEVHGVPWPTYRRLAQVLLAAARGDRARVLQLAAPLRQVENVPGTHALLAEVYRRLGESDLALEHARRVRGAEMASFVRVSVQVTTACVAWQRGDRQRAHDWLEHGLAIAVPEGSSALSPTPTR